MRRAKFVLFGVWTLSFLICFPPVVLHWPEAFSRQTGRCTCSPMGNTPGYIAYSATGSFFLPMIGIVLIYIPIYRVARKAAKSEYSNVIENEKKKQKRRDAGCLTPTDKSPKESQLLKDQPDAPFGSQELRAVDTPAILMPKSSRESRKQSVIRMVHKLTTRYRQPTTESRLSKEIKASKTVAIVTGCFIFCWIGFSVVYLLSAFPFCQNNPDCIPHAVFSVVFWLGYANSAFNPFIYAVFNRRFRNGFKALLTCRTNAYQSDSQF